MSPAYPFGEQQPSLGQALEVAPGVRWLRMPLPFALNHINLWLLQDGEAWTAVDSGLATTPIRDAWRELLPHHPLRRLIVTHCHPDHIGLAAWLQQETGAPLWMSQADYQWAQLVRDQTGPYRIEVMVEFFRCHGLGAEMRQALTDRGNAYRHGVPELPGTYRRIRDGDEITVGEQVWRVIAGFGHSPEHSSLYCEGLGVLISGDMLLPKISTNVAVMAQTPDDNPLGLFLDSIQEYTALPDDTLVLPSHGLPFRGIRARVAALRAHHEDRCNAVIQACVVPKTVAELIPVVFDRPITDPHQCMFAMGEALAHLNYLEQSRQIRRFDENGITRFVKH